MERVSFRYKSLILRSVTFRYSKFPSVTRSVPVPFHVPVHLKVPLGYWARRFLSQFLCTNILKYAMPFTQMGKINLCVFLWHFGIALWGQKIPRIWNVTVEKRNEFLSNFAPLRSVTLQGFSKCNSLRYVPLKNVTSYVTRNE